MQGLTVSDCISKANAYLCSLWFCFYLTRKNKKKHALFSKNDFNLLFVLDDKCNVLHI